MTREEAIYEIKQLAVLSTNKNIDRITEALEMAIDALERAEQTEPQTDCGSCEYSWWNGEKYRCMRNKCPYTKQTEPQTSGVVWTEDAIKDEPKSYSTWASTDEPQYDAEEVAKDINRRVAMGQRLETMSCQECKYWIFDTRWGWFCPLKGQDECKYKPKQTEPNCSEKPNNCEPQTYITEDRDTQILDAWQVHHRASTTAVEDEPQTDCCIYDSQRDYEYDLALEQIDTNFPWK